MGPSCSHSCFSAFLIEKTRPNRELLEEVNRVRRCAQKDRVLRANVARLLPAKCCKPLDPGQRLRRSPGPCTKSTARINFIEKLDQLDELVEKTRADAPRRVPRRSDGKSCQKLNEIDKEKQQRKIKNRKLCFQSLGLQASQGRGGIEKTRPAGSFC